MLRVWGKQRARARRSMTTARRPRRATRKNWSSPRPSRPQRAGTGRRGPPWGTTSRSCGRTTACTCRARPRVPSARGALRAKKYGSARRCPQRAHGCAPLVPTRCNAVCERWGEVVEVLACRIFHQPSIVVLCCVAHAQHFQSNARSCALGTRRRALRIAARWRSDGEPAWAPAHLPVAIERGELGRDHAARLQPCGLRRGGV